MPHHPGLGKNTTGAVSIPLLSPTPAPLAAPGFWAGGHSHSSVLVLVAAAGAPTCLSLPLLSQRLGCILENAVCEQSQLCWSTLPLWAGVPLGGHCTPTPAPAPAEPSLLLLWRCTCLEERGKPLQSACAAARRVLNSTTSPAHASRLEMFLCTSHSLSPPCSSGGTGGHTEDVRVPPPACLQGQSQGCVAAGCAGMCCCLHSEQPHSFPGCDCVLPAALTHSFGDVCIFPASAFMSSSVSQPLVVVVAVSDTGPSLAVCHLPL